MRAGEGEHDTGFSSGRTVSAHYDILLGQRKAPHAGCTFHAIGMVIGQRMKRIPFRQAQGPEPAEGESNGKCVARGWFPMRSIRWPITFHGERSRDGTENTKGR